MRDVVTEPVRRLSAEWAELDMSLYLSRCQIDTPPALVEATWSRVSELRASIDTVADFGAGDARFSLAGEYRSYVGFEIDGSRLPTVPLPASARVEHSCAFSDEERAFDLCIGNPPFVRNQDLPAGWRTKVADWFSERTNVRLSGLANAWQYFFLMSLLSTHDDGLCALVIPYEWVSRPSVAALRAFIAREGWRVDVHRLADHSFETVLTTASITVVDKSHRDGRWRYFDVDENWSSVSRPSTTNVQDGHVAYSRPVKGSVRTPRAIRGLSPGNQKVFVLTEGERARNGLRPGRDVVRCVTTLKHLAPDHAVLDQETFDRLYRLAGHRCWLIDPANGDNPGPLRDYLASVDEADRDTATCRDRDVWWKFKMSAVPAALVATCFKGRSPKAVLNVAQVVAVGGIAGVHGASRSQAGAILNHLSSLDLSERIVGHANGLLKMEIGQLNTIIAQADAVARA